MPYLITDIQNTLSIQRIDKNDAGLYYQAATDRFPPFTITGKKDSSLMSAAVYIKAKRKH